jgi:hypothetical protein
MVCLFVHTTKTWQQYHHHHHHHHPQERIKRVEVRNELERAIFEVKQISEQTQDKKLAGILSKAVEKTEEWLMERVETGSVAEFQVKIRELVRSVVAKWLVGGWWLVGWLVVVV